MNEEIVDTSGWSLELHAHLKWGEWILNNNELNEKLGDDGYASHEQAFSDGFKAGIAHILTQGKPNGNTL
jgi:hypothetical protein